MIIVSIYITIGNLIFKYANSIKVDSSWMNMTDTCNITLPRKLSLSKTGQPLFDLIKPGQIVKVQIGYDNLLEDVFQGYVTRVMPTIPLQIEAEDSMYLLKKERFIFSLKSANLIDILKQIWKGDIDAFDAELGSFRAEATGVKILEKIRDSYGLRSFFRGEKLVCGKPYEVENRSNFTFNYEKLQERSLEYINAEDVKLRVKAISILPNNTRIEEIIGDEDGDERTLNFYNITSASQLKKLAEAELGRLKYSGYRGSFKTFGSKVIKHGDIVGIFGDTNNDVAGTYYVDRVVSTVANNGYKQEVHLGPIAQK